MKGRPRLYTEAQYQECAQAYAEGASLEEASSIHGMNMMSLRVWMRDRGIPRRKAVRRPAKRVRQAEGYVDYAETLNLHELTGGACMQLKGLCEFRSCRYRCVGGGCALKIAENGEHMLEDVSVLIGITRQGTEQIIKRKEPLLRAALGGWR